MCAALFSPSFHVGFTVEYFIVVAHCNKISGAFARHQTGKKIYTIKKSSLKYIQSKSKILNKG